MEELLLLRNKLNSLIELRNFYIEKKENKQLVEIERQIENINNEIDKLEG